MHLIFETLQTVHANFSRRFIEKKKNLECQATSVLGEI